MTCNGNLTVRCSSDATNIPVRCQGVPPEVVLRLTLQCALVKYFQTRSVMSCYHPELAIDQQRSPAAS